MIRKLRFRFALTVILSALLILVVLIGTINIVNYHRVVSDSDRELSMYTRPADMPQMPRPRADVFSAVYDNDGNLTESFTSWNSMYAAENMEEYAEEVLKGSRDRGFIGDLRFSRRTMDGSTSVVLVDCRMGLQNFRNFLTSSILLSLVCLALVSIAAVTVSGRAVKPVAESYEKQKRFITDAGHEIKTPLAIINADADVLLAEIGDGNEWVNDIKTQIQRLTALTNNLIRLTRMEEGTDNLKLMHVNLTQIVTEQVLSFRSVAAADDKTLVCDAVGNVYTEGDADALRELVSILIDNAVKYSPGHGKINVTCGNKDGTAVITVSNNTVEPLDKEQMDRLFDRFYRADPSRNSDKGGFGIGLATAKATVEAHGGSIAASKQSASEILFTVMLPLSQQSV